MARSRDRETTLRLAQHLNDRRLELRLTWAEVADRAGISRDTMHNVRVGTSDIRDLTERGIEVALQWEPGSIDRIFAGNDPIPLELPVDARVAVRSKDVDQPTGQLTQRGRELMEQVLRLLSEIEDHIRSGRTEAAEAANVYAQRLVQQAAGEVVTEQEPKPEVTDQKQRPA